jgi:hypothetical protein
VALHQLLMQLHVLHVAQLSSISAKMIAQKLLQSALMSTKSRQRQSCTSTALRDFLLLSMRKAQSQKLQSAQHLLLLASKANR